ncbi:MAG: proteasome-type protease [Gammaproteobacteria bacterium]|nr:proteasome-type protease [Gammaproteobacteria bacterium]MDH3411410.1 proteasome-type protease [Gammaproteobacteria bacterium]
MTYCLAINVDQGLVFASDSRTNAGVDQVSHYGKMFTFSREGERQLVVLTAGNLATTQSVIDRLKRDIRDNAKVNFLNVESMPDAAEYLGDVAHKCQAKRKEAVTQAGFSAEVSFILGGQIRGGEPHIFLVYPQGNYITSSDQTPYLQLGEFKYGRPILDRVLSKQTELDEAARCALVSIDSTMRSNASVGPPLEVLCYGRDSFTLDRYLCLEADDPYLLEIRRQWGEKISLAFSELPHFTWNDLPSNKRFESSVT